MTLADHKGIAQAIFSEIFIGGDKGAIDKYFAPDVIKHGTGPGAGTGIAAIHTQFRELYQAFPDCRITLEDMVAEGDKLAGRLTMRGVHRGPYLGVPATGKHVKWTDIQLVRFAGGQVVEHWLEWDAVGLLEQLGVLPLPPTPAVLPGRRGEIRGHLHAARSGRQASPATNKAIIRRWLEESWNKGNLAVYSELMHPQAPRHDHRHHFGYSAHPADRARMLADLRAASPDVQITIENQIAEGDKVATRWTLSGTFQNAFMGIPPTGQLSTVTGIDISHVIHGQVVEDWSEWDRLGFLQQLGVLGRPPAG